METVIKKMRERCFIPDESIERLMSCVARCEFPRRHKIVEDGRMRGHAYFIEKGITRSYWVVDGEEITTSFSTEGSIVFSMDELYYGRKSEEFVEAIEPVVAYSITIEDLRHLWETDIYLAGWGLAIHQDEYRRLHRSHKERLTLTAAQRYDSFRRQFPEVCGRVQLGYIASYLGITLPTLSRLRKKM